MRARRLVSGSGMGIGAAADDGTQFESELRRKELAAGPHARRHSHTHLERGGMGLAPCADDGSAFDSLLRRLQARAPPRPPARSPPLSLSLSLPSRLF